MGWTKFAVAVNLRVLGTVLVSSPRSVRAQVVALLTNHTTDGYLALAAVEALPQPKDHSGVGAWSLESAESACTYFFSEQVTENSLNFAVING